MIKNCEGFKELCAFTAAGAATPAEEKTLFVHIASCTDCHNRLLALKEAGLHLLTALTQVSPPLSIRTNLLNAMEQEKNITPRFPSAPPVMRKSWLVRFPWMRVIVWAVAGIVGVILFQNINADWQAAGRQEAEIALLRRTLSEKDAALISMRLSLSEKEEVLTLIEAQKTIVVALTGEPSFPHALGKAFWNPERNAGLFFAFDLPSPKEGRVYQLWAHQRDSKVDAGVFSFSINTGSFKIKPIPNPTEAVSFFTVTFEPAGGSPQPTGEVVLGGEVSSG